LRMITKNSKYSFDYRIVFGILTILVVTNAAWVIIFKSSAPVIALIFYLFVIFLFWWQNDIFSGIIVGSIGSAIHLYELIFHGIAGLIVLESIFFFINLILPLPLVILCFNIYKKTKQRDYKK